MTPADAPGPAAVDASGRAEALFRAALGLATLAMLGLSWPLWVEPSAFPRVPFVRGLPAPPAGASWLLFGLLIAGVAAGLVRRGMIGASLLPLVVLIAQDQHRFQPWIYQYGMIGLALATLGPRRALAGARLFVIALYFHSGLSKLDASFATELGPTFLATALAPLGLEPRAWSAPARTAAALAMPLAELAVAVGLAIPRARRWALAGAVALHAALIGILGPWGLGHSAIVLVWNAALIVEDLILFGPGPVPPPEDGSPAEADTRLAPVAHAALVLAAVLPLGERWGLFDSWPSFALYASHAERTEVFLHEDDLGAYPESIRRHLAGAAGLSPWRRLDLTGWSRTGRGVPVYPQGRAGNGVAEALAARYRGALPVRVIQWGRADALAARRRRNEVYGLDAIRRLGNRYRLNAHPSARWVDQIFTAENAETAERKREGKNRN
ncbi:MAG TPA: MauE/DoxX family redox-associated membrane protein [Isosphaeraceae bacterium]